MKCLRSQNNFKNEMEDVMSKVASHLKKEYKKITGKTLSLTPQEECDILVQSTSRVRVFVTCNKVYKLGGLEEIADNEYSSSLVEIIMLRMLPIRLLPHVDI